MHSRFWQKPSAVAGFSSDCWRDSQPAQSQSLTTSPHGTTLSEHKSQSPPMSQCWWIQIIWSIPSWACRLQLQSVQLWKYHLPHSKESIPGSNVLKYIQICHTKQTNTTTCWSFTNFNEQIECYAHLSRQPSSVHVPRLSMVSIAKEPALVQSRVSFSLSLSRNLPRRCEQLQWPRPKNTWKLFWWR